jgi:hypothetical protein
VDKEDMNYCRCGEYLAPGKEKCEYGCGRLRPGLYCTRATKHDWVEPARYVRDEDQPVVCPACSRERWDLFRDRINWQSRDKAHWRSTFRYAQRSVYTIKHFDVELYILLRRYNIRLPRSQRGEDPVADYGAIYGWWLKHEINAMVARLDESCLDNIRFADMSNRKDMKRYRKAKASGCCGYHDEVVTTLTGRKFTIGCNYGH